MKRFFFIGILSVFGMQSYAQQMQPDYRLYHKGIIDAEQAIFIDSDPGKGLHSFKNTFAQYHFAWVDDCIEAFQLALFFGRDDMAMLFIKKALDNGFELKQLARLSPGTPCNYYKGLDTPVTIHKDFIAKNKAVLAAYAAKVYPAYVRRIDRKVFENIVKRHVEEQLYKNGVPGLAPTFEIQWKAYDKISASNLRYMDSLAGQHIFVGERLLGIYTGQLVDSLHLPYGSMARYRDYLLKRHKLPANTAVPIVTEGDYFFSGPVYIMLFHNTQSYQRLLPYSEEAIRLGYWHPRELASLRFNTYESHAAVADPLDLHLENYCLKLSDTKKINEVRASLLLPSYEIDYAKLQFAQKNHLQLSFGFFNGTR